MKFHPSSCFARSLIAAATALALGLLLTGAKMHDDRPARPLRVFHGSGCLPLSGDLAGAGDAFRQGFLEGVRSMPDSLSQWKWDWTDNGSDPVLAQAFADTVGQAIPCDLVLGGLGSAMEGLVLRTGTQDSLPFRGWATDPVRHGIPWLLLGDGPSADGGVWNLWPTTVRMRSWLLGVLQKSPGPVAIVVTASGSWTDVVFTGIRDSVPGVLILPHDLDNTRWDDAIRWLLETRPGTILFWDRPGEASSLLSKRLGWSVFRKSRLLVPEGTVLPDSMQASVLSPLWQPASPPDSLQCARYRSWGREAGRSLVAASDLALRDSLANLIVAFRNLPPDTLAREAWSDGWSPVFAPKIPAANPPQPDSGH